MNLKQVAFNWERLGRRDALGSILTELPDSQDAWDEQAFFETGAQEVARISARVLELGLNWGGERALDFGCGVGRIGRHLLDDYRMVDGIDVAKSMIDLGTELGRSTRMRFLLNQSSDLSLVADDAYDLVLSLITLQHMPPSLACAYIKELIRKAKPGGTIFFQLPLRSHRRSEALLAENSPKQRWLARLPAGILERYRLLRTGRPRMDMFGLPMAEVLGLLRASNVELVAADEAQDAGDLLPSLRYFARKPMPS